MTTTLAPPAPVTPPRSRRAPRRAVRRWAWRLLRREWRQQLLVLALITAAVAATTVGLGVVGNVQSSDQALAGTATTRVDIVNPGGGVTADVSAARQAFGTVEAIAHENVPVPGSVTPVDLRAQDPHGVYGAVMLHLVSGHYPSGADQVAVTSSVAQTFGLKLGSTWHADGRTLRVVGLVENPKNLQDGFGLVAAGQLRAPTGLTLLTDAGQTAVQGFRPPAGSVQSVFSTGASASEQQRNHALAVLLLATIGLTFVGLLAVAGFTMLAQRRLRALGMIGALGATGRQVRGVLLANGVAVGAVGGCAGALLGLVVWFALRPAFEQLVGHLIDPLALPWWAIVAAVALAILTALAASWWPARSAARMPIVAALSGRPGPPRPAHHFAVLGAAVAAGGFVLLVLAHAQHTAMIVTGIVATVAGMLLIAPLGIRALAAGAGRAPVAMRLALRDLARFQARSGAALAAASLAVGIAATIAVSAAAQQAADHSLTHGNLPRNQLLVWLSGNPNDFGPAPAPQGAGAGGPSPTEVSRGRAAAESIAQSLRAGRPLELDIAAVPANELPPGAPPLAAQAELATPITVRGQQGFNLITAPYVATPAVLAWYGIRANQLPPGAGILTSRTDISGAEIMVGKGSGHRTAIHVEKRLPSYSSAPNTLISEKEMAALGMSPRPTGWLLQTPHALTAAQITDAQHRAAAAGISVETRTAPDNSLQRLRDYSTATGILVALGVLAMTVGLIRSETAGDLRTLTAAGASSGTRRTLNATTAGALGLLGGVLGTAGAYLALIAWHWHDPGYLAHPPYADLALVLFGLPVAAAAGGWLLGRAPTAISRRPLE